MTSTCGGRLPLARSASRCSTPKRCCSSTTTRPRSANSTPSCSSAWVPTTMPACPSATSARASRRAAAFSEPVSSATRVPSASPSSSPARPSGPSSAPMLRACWAASTSVGASSAACPPASTTCGHRPQRDDGLARADLALQQPVHRLLAGELGGELLPDLPLALGERERQRRVEGVEQPAGRAAAGRCRAPARRRGGGRPGCSCRTSASSHFSRSSARSTSSGVVGPVHVEQRGGQGRAGRAGRAAPRAAGRRASLGESPECVQQQLHRLLDHPAGDVLAGRVDRAPARGPSRRRRRRSRRWQSGWVNCSSPR